MKSLITWILLLFSLATYAQKIESFIYSECDESCDISRVVNRIAYSNFRNGTMTIEFGTLSNCAGMFNPTAKYTGDTLRINFEDYITDITIDKNGNEVKLISQFECVCYFISEYMITELPNRPEIVTLNGKVMNYYPDMYKLYPVTFEILDGDTINYTDKYGFQQGKWIFDLPNGGYSLGYQKDGKYVRLDRKTFHTNGTLKSEYLQDSVDIGFGKSYYENQKLENVNIKTGKDKNNLIWYYPNGSLKRQYFTNGSSNLEINFYENGEIKEISGPGIFNEYYPSGQLKIQRLYSNNPKDIWAIYHYENGACLAILYIKKIDYFESDSWWEFFDLEGNSVSKEYIEGNGNSWIFK